MSFAFDRSHSHLQMNTRQIIVSTTVTTCRKRCRKLHKFIFIFTSVLNLIYYFKNAINLYTMREN